jgi:drug/metabolite transporter (DMT)-like permease
MVAAGEQLEPETPARVHLTLILVQTIFGAFPVAGKAVLAEVAPLALAAMRVLGATPLLLWIAWQQDRFLPSRRDLPLLALLGLLGVAANQVLFILGLERTTATNAAILMPSIPVFTVVVAAVLRIERPGPRRVAGVLLAVVGALVMLRPWRFEGTGGVALGNALILVNCLSYAAFLVLQRPLLRRLPWRTVIAWSFLFGGLMVLGLGLAPLAALEPAAVSTSVWLGIAFIVLFPTFVTYLLSTWAVARSSPSTVAAYTTLQPPVAALLAVPLLGEALGWPEAAGFALIASGLFFVTRSPSWRRRPLPPPAH